VAEQITRISALARVYHAGRFGAAGDDDQIIQIHERRPLSIMQLNAWADTADDVIAQVQDSLGIAPSREAMTAIGDDNLRALWIAPDRWLLVKPEQQGLTTELMTQLPREQVGIFDQSHARTVLRIAGPHTRTLLAKLCGLDFHPDCFAPGSVKTSLLGHHLALIDCVDTDTFDLYLMRTFAQSAWEVLTQAGEEFGCRVNPPSLKS
jgi:heterotetrameric sarcosine oxidase gamma subunit